MIIICLCVVALAGCKKDQKQTETGDVHSSPVSVMGDEIKIDMPPMPPPGMKGLRVETPPSPIPLPGAMPDMALVPGTDMSVRISTRMKTTPGWTSSFAYLLPVITNCLMKVDHGAAYVTYVTDHDNDVLGIDISALDGRHFYCHTSENGAVSITATEGIRDQAESVLFFPRQAGAPVLDHPDCYEKEPVVARPQGLIGWLAFPLPACP